jgi:hypothetical protein
VDRCDEGGLQAARQRLCRISAKALSKSLSRSALAKQWRRDAALRVLGFTPERMRLRTYWEAERVVTKIHFLRKKGVPLYPAYVPKHYAGLFSAALRIFGSWQTHYLSPVSKFLTARMMAVAEFYGHCVMLWNSIRRMIAALPVLTTSREAETAHDLLLR